MKSVAKVWISGFDGRMGTCLREVIENAYANQLRVVGGSGKDLLLRKDGKTEKVNARKVSSALGESDLILDFTNKDGNQQLLQILEKASPGKIRIVIGSTGLGEEQISKWKKLAKAQGLAVLLAQNTSIGIFVLNSVARTLAKALYPKGFDIEIVEAHHRDKLDAPSGTALMLGKTLAASQKLQLSFPHKKKREKNSVGISSVRGGKVFGEHEILFLGDEEELRISHRALSRMVFAKGACDLALWLGKQKTGFYDLGDLALDSLIT